MSRPETAGRSDRHRAPHARRDGRAATTHARRRRTRARQLRRTAARNEYPLCQRRRSRHGHRCGGRAGRRARRRLRRRGGGSGDVRVSLGKTLYRSGDDVVLDAQAPQSSGDALLTLESAQERASRRRAERRREARKRTIARAMRPANCASARPSCATARSSGRRCRCRSKRPADRNWSSLALGGDGSFAPGEAAKVSFARCVPGARNGGRAGEPRRAVGKRAVRFGAGTAGDRCDVDAEQRARRSHVASVGRFDRRSRARSRIRAPHAAARPALARRKPTPQAVSWSVERAERDRFRRADAHPERTLHALGARDFRRRQRPRRFVERRRTIGCRMSLMLLDTYGLVYRAFFALPGLTTSRGRADQRRLRLHDDAQQAHRRREADARRRRLR